MCSSLRIKTMTNVDVEHMFNQSPKCHMNTLLEYFSKNYGERKERCSKIVSVLLLEKPIA
jgi:hypothetical protein